MNNSLFTGVSAVVGECGTIPVIDNSENNMVGSPPYPESATVEYSCQNLYIPQGNPQYTCTGEEWIGSFTCRIIECSALERPLHGQMIGDNYEVGSVMRFKCDPGYDIVGSDRLLCQSDSNWEPPNEPVCQIKRCPTTPSVQHGTVSPEHTVDGETDVYGVILAVQCDGNHIRTGPSRIYCNEDGEWTEKPKCEAVACPPYPGLDAKCVLKSKLAAGNMLFFLYCTENATFVQSSDSEGTAFCENGDWDDPSLRCYCNCEIHADSDLVTLENLDARGFLEHGKTLEWSCKHGATKASMAFLTCNDGSVGTPVCTPAPTPSPTETTTTGTKLTKLTTQSGKGSTDTNVTEPGAEDEPLAAWVIIVIICGALGAASAVAGTLIAKKKKSLCFKNGHNSNASASEPEKIKEKPDTVLYTNEEAGDSLPKKEIEQLEKTPLNQTEN